MSASDHYCRSVLQRMLAQMSDEPYEDVVVEVKDTNFLCHRFILSSCSMFFRALFRSGMSEALQQMVELKDMEPATFQLILDCIYGGKTIITRENVLTIWQAATLLQIDFLQESCKVFLMGNVDKENCVEVYISAKHLDSKQVSTLAWGMILGEFEYLVEATDVFLLDHLDMERLIGSQELRVQSEDIVVNAIKEWIKLYEPVVKSESKTADNTNESQPDKNSSIKAVHSKGKKAKNAVSKDANFNNKVKTGAGVIGSLGDQENRLATLLGASRLCLASASCLRELLGDPNVLQNPTALWHVQNALWFHLQPERRYDFCPTAAVFRSEDDLANVLVSISSPSSNNCQPSLVGKRSSHDEWHTLATGSCSYSLIHDQCNSVVYGNSIYGTACDFPGNVTYMFQFTLQKNNTLTFAMMGQQGLVNRVHHATVCHENYLYIVGGDNGELSVDRFDLDGPPTGQWETVGQLIQPVSSVAATVLGSVIIVIGNVNTESKDETISLIQCFDLKTNCTYLQTDTVPHASEKRVLVKHWSEVYLLQEGGDLWRLMTTGDRNRINLDYRGRLWNTRVDLTSAIIYKEELIVLAQPPPAPAPAQQAAAADGEGEGRQKEEEKVPARWETPEHELFKRVQIVREDKCCLMTTVMPNVLIPKKS